MPATQRLLDPVLEQGPVGQVGQRVVERLVHQLVLQLLALADVAGVEHQTADAGVVEQVGDGHLGLAQPTVAVGIVNSSDPRRVRPAARTRSASASPRRAASSSMVSGGR